MRVQVVTITQQQASVTYSGTVSARVMVELAFRVGGKIVARPVNIGDHVVPNQVLAQLDPTDLQLDVDAAQSAVDAAEAEAANAQALFARYDKLGRASPSFVESEFGNRQAATRTADARLERARRQLDIARVKLQYTTLRAHNDGVVTAMTMEPGQVVAPGQKVGLLAHTAETEVTVDVPENRLDEVRTAEDVILTLWSAPGRPFHGRVREIGALANAASRTFAVKVSVLDLEGAQMALGMTASARFTGLPGPPLAILPATALTTSGGEPAVWVLNENTHRAVLNPVRIVAFDGDGKVQISNGLSGGQLVVTAGADLIDRDLPVTAWRGPTR